MIAHRNQENAIGLINGLLSNLLGMGPRKVGRFCFYLRALFRNREGRLLHEE